MKTQPIIPGNISTYRGGRHPTSRRHSYLLIRCEIILEEGRKARCPSQSKNLSTTKTEIFIFISIWPPLLSLSQGDVELHPSPEGVSGAHQDLHPTEEQPSCLHHRRCGTEWRAGPVRLCRGRRRVYFHREKGQVRNWERRKQEIQGGLHNIQT